MRILLSVLGLVCVLVGTLWLLQGFNVVQGSFMTGQRRWALYGAVLLVVGVGVLVAANRRRP